LEQARATPEEEKKQFPRKGVHNKRRTGGKTRSELQNGGKSPRVIKNRERGAEVVSSCVGPLRGGGRKDEEIQSLGAGRDFSRVGTQRGRKLSKKTVTWPLREWNTNTKRANESKGQGGKVQRMQTESYIVNRKIGLTKKKIF